VGKIEIKANSTQLKLKLGLSLAIHPTGNLECGSAPQPLVINESTQNYHIGDN
jgi:hypothetical protein